MQPQSQGRYILELDVALVVVEEADVSPEQKSEMLRLQIDCFSAQVTAEEVEEDFNRPSVASVLLYYQHELIACSEIFKRVVEYEGQTIVIGGMGPCTREDWRSRGVGTRVCEAAMDYLRRQGCDIAFLSVDIKLNAHPLYERLGFRMLTRPFIYANVRGELKESDGGMIAPLCSQELFDLVLRGKKQFSLTPETGYW